VVRELSSLLSEYSSLVVGLNQMDEDYLELSRKLYQLSQSPFQSTAILTSYLFIYPYSSLFLSIDALSERPDQMRRASIHQRIFLQNNSWRANCTVPYLYFCYLRRETSDTLLFHLFFFSLKGKH